MHLAKGILTATGGKASHAAVVARGWGKPCVVGCDAIAIDEMKGQFTINGHVVKAGDFVTINGTTGEVMIGKVPTVDPTISGHFAELMSWADKVRTLKVRTNADTPDRRRQGPRSFGAEGIGLCRTEHMFFEGQRIVDMRKMILADDEEGRKKALAELEPLPEAGLHRHLRGDGRPAGDHPPARPAAPRVPAARRGRPGRGRPPARHPRREGQAPGRAAPRGQPDARPPRLPAAHQVPRDRRHAGPGDPRGGHRGQEEGQDASCPRS